MRAPKLKGEDAANVAASLRLGLQSLVWRSKQDTRNGRLPSGSTVAGALKHRLQCRPANHPYSGKDCCHGNYSFARRGVTMQPRDGVPQGKTEKIQRDKRKRYDESKDSKRKIIGHCYHPAKKLEVHALREALLILPHRRMRSAAAYFSFFLRRTMRNGWPLGRRITFPLTVIVIR
ncbi:hypothetical protein DP42_4720 [Burkholderia pseudomallei]|nr:hypothetical protein DP42_4720 [Burkholderia pseudomallei]